MERLRLEQANQLQNIKIFFDANIWLFLHCPQGGYNQDIINNYSSYYASLLNSSNSIYTDIMVLSEVTNRYLRISYSIYIGPNSQRRYDYKRDYQRTSDFKSAYKEIKNIVLNKIIPHTEITNPQYTRDTLEALWEDNPEILDFNDKHIINLCKENRLYLLTHDADFKNSDIDIISSNRKIFS